MVFEKVKEVIADQLGITGEEINEKTSLMRDLKADSLSAVEIIMAIEEEYGIEIEEEDAEKFESVGDIVAYVETRI